MLESLCHGDNTFATLTYNEEMYPVDSSVNPRELQLFLKRLRERTGLSIRFFGVGEYGDLTGRPHYHLALFGYPNCANAQTRYDRGGETSCCAACSAVQRAWRKDGKHLGRIQLAPLEPKAMQYICGYVVKKMTRDDDIRLEGRLPEFARMSLRPGIGHDMMHDLANTLMKHGLEDRLLDVPSTLQHGRSALPLGRYLRKKLRLMVGKDEKTPPEVLEELRKKMQPLREAAFLSSTPFREKVLEASLGSRIKLEAREKRNSKKARL